MTAQTLTRRTRTSFRHALGAVAVMLGFLCAPLVPATAQIESLVPDNDVIEAIKARDAEALKLVLQRMSPNVKDVDGVPAIIRAVATKEEKLVEILLKAGARPDDRDEDRRSALTLAAELNELAEMRLLIEHEADVDLPGSQSETALLKAARLGHIDAVRILLEANAYPDDTDLTGRTALEYARLNGHEAVAELLLQYGATDY